MRDPIRTLHPIDRKPPSLLGDKDIAQWQPPLASFRCTYARAWVQVKHYYDLTIDSAEKSALESILDAC